MPIGRRKPEIISSAVQPPAGVESHHLSWPIRACADTGHPVFPRKRGTTHCMRDIARAPVRPRLTMVSRECENESGGSAKISAGRRRSGEAGPPPACALRPPWPPVSPSVEARDGARHGSHPRVFAIFFQPAPDCGKIWKKSPSTPGVRAAAHISRTKMALAVGGSDRGPSLPVGGPHRYCSGCRHTLPLTLSDCDFFICLRAVVGPRNAPAAGSICDGEESRPLRSIASVHHRAVDLLATRPPRALLQPVQRPDSLRHADPRRTTKTTPRQVMGPSSEIGLAEKCSGRAGPSSPHIRVKPLIASKIDSRAQEAGTVAIIRPVLPESR